MGSLPRTVTIRFRIALALAAAAVAGLVCAVAPTVEESASAQGSPPLRVSWTYRAPSPGGSFRLYRGHSVRSLRRIAQIPSDAGAAEVARAVENAGDRSEAWVFQLRFASEDGPETVLGTLAWVPPGMSRGQSAAITAGNGPGDLLAPAPLELDSEAPQRAANAVVATGPGVLDGSPPSPPPRRGGC